MLQESISFCEPPLVLPGLDNWGRGGRRARRGEGGILGFERLKSIFILVQVWLYRESHMGWPLNKEKKNSMWVANQSYILRKCSFLLFTSSNFFPIVSQQGIGSLQPVVDAAVKIAFPFGD